MKGMVSKKLRTYKTKRYEIAMVKAISIYLLGSQSSRFDCCGSSVWIIWHSVPLAKFPNTFSGNRWTKEGIVMWFVAIPSDAREQYVQKMFSFFSLGSLIIHKRGLGSTLHYCIVYKQDTIQNKRNRFHKGYYTVAKSTGNSLRCGGYSPVRCLHHKQLQSKKGDELPE